jgi:hypothetical protein
MDAHHPDDITGMVGEIITEQFPAPGRCRAQAWPPKAAAMLHCRSIRGSGRGHVRCGAALPPMMAATGNSL